MAAFDDKALELANQLLRDGLNSKTVRFKVPKEESEIVVIAVKVAAGRAQIKKAHELLDESMGINAYTLSGSGNICRYCNGTGRS